MLVIFFYIIKKQCNYCKKKLQKFIGNKWPQFLNFFLTFLKKSYQLNGYFDIFFIYKNIFFFTFYIEC